MVKVILIIGVKINTITNLSSEAIRITKILCLVQLGWLTAPSCAIETDVLMRIADNATNQFMRSDEDMKKWYKTYYEAVNKFYKAKPELICPGPEELIDMLEDLEDQIEKVVA